MIAMTTGFGGIPPIWTAFTQGIRTYGGSAIEPVDVTEADPSEGVSPN